MDIHNLKSCVRHDEAMIDSFIRDPDFADYYMRTVKDDGNEDEIRDVQAWYDEAKSRTYWNALLDYAEKTAHNGLNIDYVIARLSQALTILQAAAKSQSA